MLAGITKRLTITREADELRRGSAALIYCCFRKGGESQSTLGNADFYALAFPESRGLKPLAPQANHRNAVALLKAIRHGYLSHG
jgi:hypothetical protein